LDVTYRLGDLGGLCGLQACSRKEENLRKFQVVLALRNMRMTTYTEQWYFIFEFYFRSRENLYSKIICLQVQNEIMGNYVC